MDAITWMGVCAWRKGGVWGFMAFTGLSILPQTLTLGDVLSRRRRDVLAFTVEIVSKMGWVYSRCAPRDVDFTSDVVNFSVIHRVETR